MKWISIKKQLPKYTPGVGTEIVIVSGIYRGVRYVHYAEIYAYCKKGTAEDIFSIPGWTDMGVTHWMPLPNAPKTATK